MTLTRAMIEAEGFGGTEPYEEISAHFNSRPMIANPIAQSDIPASLSLEGFLAILTDKEVGKIMGINIFSQWAASLKQNVAFTKQTQLSSVIAAIIQSGNISGFSMVGVANGLVKAGDRTALIALAECLNADGVPPTISDETLVALQAAMAAKEPDPNYQPQVQGEPVYSKYGLSKAVTNTMVQEALN